MAAHEHLNGEQLSMFLPAKTIMSTIGAIDAEVDKVHEPLSQSVMREEWQGYSHSDEANKKSKVVDIKRIENSIRHDFSQFGTDPKTINEGETLVDSIKRSGIKNPISLGKVKNTNKPWVILNGQHRAVAAYDINPDMEVPVEYSSKIIKE